MHDLAGAHERLFDRFDAILRARGYLAMGGQIVDATVIEARRPRLSRDEKETINGGGVPGHWSKAKRSQMDTGSLDAEARQETPGAAGPLLRQAEILVPAFGYRCTGTDQAEAPALYAGACRMTPGVCPEHVEMRDKLNGLI